MDPPLVSLRHRPPCFPEDPLDIARFSLGVPQTQAPMLSGGSLGILPWCTLRHRPPCCPGDPLDIRGSSLGVLSDTGPHAVRRIPWTSRLGVPSDTGPHAVRGIPWTSPMLSEGFLGHPGILPWCPLRHRPHAVWRIPWTSRDPPLESRQTQAPMLSGGTLEHPGILPWCPIRYRPPCCPEDPLDIPGSSLGVPLDIPGSQACQSLQFKTLETRWGKDCTLHQLGGCGPNGIISGIILSL